MKAIIRKKQKGRWAEYKQKARKEEEKKGRKERAA